jgi:hypothetical protein
MYEKILISILLQCEYMALKEIKSVLNENDTRNLAEEDESKLLGVTSYLPALKGFCLPTSDLQLLFF